MNVKMKLFFCKNMEKGNICKNLLSDVDEVNLKIGKHIVKTLKNSAFGLFCMYFKV